MIENMSKRELKLRLKSLRYDEKQHFLKWAKYQPTGDAEAAMKAEKAERDKEIIAIVARLKEL